ISVNEASLIVPSGFRVSINGGTWHAGSPALTLLSGSLIVSNATFVNATDAPTILVSGGSLTLRNDVIQESTGFNGAAISVTGATLPRGPATPPGDNPLTANASGEFTHNTPGTLTPAVGDTFPPNGPHPAAPVLSFTDLPPPANSSIYGQAVTFTATVQ